MDRTELFTRTGRTRKNTWKIWEGPSRIDGSPLVVFATGLRGSGNGKTGDMVQTHILRADVDPLEAVETGQDVSICGSCPLKGIPGKRKRTCYVKVFHAPLGIFRAWKRGNVPEVAHDSEHIQDAVRGRMVRLGAYGDPAAVPVQVWRDLLATAAGHTGYTHQANRPDLQDTLELCQLSADSLEDAEVARDAGIGSFRVLRPGQEPAPWEMTCPASEEAGKVATCAECGACTGADGANVAIRAHGNLAGNIQETRPRYRRGISLPVLG